MVRTRRKNSFKPKTWILNEHSLPPVLRNRSRTVSESLNKGEGFGRTSTTFALIAYFRVIIGPFCSWNREKCGGILSKNV